MEPVEAEVGVVASGDQVLARWTGTGDSDPLPQSPPRMWLEPPDRFGTGSTHATRGPHRSQMPESTRTVTSSRLPLRRALRSLHCSDRVAVALRGRRGSQRRSGQDGVAGPRGGGRPPGRPRIATRPRGRVRRSEPGVAVALAAGRGSQHQVAGPGERLDQRGGRPRRRPRIATSSPPRVRCCRSVAVALGGGRGSQPGPSGGVDTGQLVAVALEGGRGSQRRTAHRSGLQAGKWRSPSGAPEGRNMRMVREALPGAEVAVALRGRPRIATRSARSRHGRTREVAVALRGVRGSQRRAGRDRPQGAVVAVALDGGRGSQPQERHASGFGLPGGGRLAGRPRIATASSTAAGGDTDVAVALRDDRESQPRGAEAMLQQAQVAAALRGGRGSQLVLRSALVQRQVVAVALEGGRGSQRRTAHRSGLQAGKWRSPSGVAEDRNDEVVTGIRHHLAVAVVLRGTEDRNLCSYSARSTRTMWRSPFRAAEDRNPAYDGVWDYTVQVAVALPGGRGSQLGLGVTGSADDAVAVGLRGGRGSQLVHAGESDVRSEGGGCPSGRPRIATCGPGATSPPGAWRWPLASVTSASS